MTTLIRTDELIAKFQYALDNKWGYILGATHTKWTESAQNGKIETMRNAYGNDWKSNDQAKKNANYMAAMYGSKWIGHWVTDCSGLFAWAFKELGGYMYHGSNTMWNKYCVAKGKLSNGKRTDGQELKPGTAVFVLKNGTDRSHVGLYIGNDTVIEASGTKSGVITTKITHEKWAEWGELKGVSYGSSSSVPAPAPDSSTIAGTAIVNATRVALRTGPSTNAAILTRVDKGERVEVEESNWTKVKYHDKEGYMMTKFLDLNT